MMLMFAADINGEIILAQVARLKHNPNHEQGGVVAVVHRTRNAEVCRLKRVHIRRYARLGIHAAPDQ